MCQMLVLFAQVVAFGRLMKPRAIPAYAPRRSGRMGRHRRWPGA